MKLIADLHIHSSHSRGCSKDLTIANLEKWARIKGVNLLGTGDFTHPKWIEEIKQSLREEDGLLYTKSGFPFVLQTEISLIYTHDGKGRKIHNVVLAPSLEVVDQITEELLKRGRVDYDGRPIFKIPCPEFVSMLRNISKDIEVIPAHIWTPWFSLFGSNSGFDSVKDCFQEQTKHIHALETGLSSDPEMNWRLSQLDPYLMVSFSDSHSYWPWRLGREATIIDIKLNYKNLLKTIRTREGFASTVEVNPSYGKYHIDGHRMCNVHMTPSESKKHNDICPSCGRKLTIGVLHRVEELADREEGYRPDNAQKYRTLIPLSEILSKLLNKGIATKAIWNEYNCLIKEFGSEYNILLNAREEDLAAATKDKIAAAIIKNREGKIKVEPGYDGVYGEPIFNEEKLKPQKDLKEFF